MTAADKRIERVLTWCNRVRAKAGLRPLNRMPKGVQGSGCLCPIALAVGLAFDQGIHVTRHSTLGAQTFTILVKHPKYISKFVNDFDADVYPQLVR